MSTMRNAPQVATNADWTAYRKSHRALQRMEVRTQLLHCYGAHRRCTFEIGGKRMSGREVADCVVRATDAQLRAFHAAAQQHRREKGRRL